MIKGCGTALTTIHLELVDKQANPATVWGRVYTGRRMNELCPWLGEMGIGAERQCADSPVPGLRETRAEYRSRLDAMRVARYGHLGELAAIQNTAGTSCLAPLGRVSSDSQTYLTVPGPHIDIRHESVVS